MKQSSINTITFFTAIVLIAIAAITDTVWLGIAVIAAPFLILPIMFIYWGFIDKIRDKKVKKKRKEI